MSLLLLFYGQTSIGNLLFDGSEAQQSLMTLQQLYYCKCCNLIQLIIVVRNRKCIYQLYSIILIYKIFCSYYSRPHLRDTYVPRLAPSQYYFHIEPYRLQHWLVIWFEQQELNQHLRLMLPTSFGRRVLYRADVHDKL